MRFFVLAFALILSFASAAQAGRLTLTEENDSFASDNDRHYTQGLRLSYLSGPITPDGLWDHTFDWAANTFGIYENGSAAHRQIEWTLLGQSLFTPENIKLANPDSKDRPYAGWLYVGGAFLQERPITGGTTLENVEVLVGMVGPAALGRQTQNDFHTLIHVAQAQGWAYQLKNEPGIMLTYERRSRFSGGKFLGLEVDAIPNAGATVGNIMSYAQLGATFRIGSGLGADYGPAQIRPGISGTGWFDDEVARGHVGGYLFVGAQGRLVGRNIFLDGNSFRDSRSVSKKPVVYDLVGGASVFFSDWVKIDLSAVRRSLEFNGQKATDRFGMISLSVKFW